MVSSHGYPSKMKRYTTFIVLLLCSLSMMLHTGCTDDDGESSIEPAMLYIHVFSPDNPVVTRADIGDVDPTDAEKTVHKLQIWVFSTVAYTDDNGVNHPANELVGYLEPNDLSVLNSSKSDTYMMAVPDAFVLQQARAPKPNVDVYVLVNVEEENCGVTYDKNSTKAQLDAAVLQKVGSTDYFGPQTKQSTVPTDGLPMSGRLLNQEIYGSSPVLRIGTEGSVTTVPLVRMVSKVLFIFSRFNGSSEQLEITSVTIDGNVTDTDADKTKHLPKQEYMFFNGTYNYRNFKVGTEYETSPINFLTSSLVSTGFNSSGEPNEGGQDIAGVSDIFKYQYAGQESQVYEDLVYDGISKNELTAVGPYYFRETGLRLKGTINYKIAGSDEVHTASFSLSEPADFSRNHSWIVYIYYRGGHDLLVDMVYVTQWRTGASVSHELYNW